VKRREFISLIGGAAAAWPLAAHAQQPGKLPTIGYLGTGSGRDSLELSAFRQGLGEASFAEGKNVAIEYRITDDYTRMPALAVELVQRQVAVIVAISTPAALAAKAATTTIPIVFAIGDDPVRFGLVAALNRPGGNATGVNVVAIALEAKRMGTLRELVPAAGTIGVLVNPKNPNAAKQSDDVRDVARTIERQIYILNAENEQEIHAAFTTLTQRRIGAFHQRAQRRGHHRHPPTRRPPGGVPSGLQRKSPAQRGALVTHSLLARRLVAVTAIHIDVGRAHIAASHWAVPFIRLGRLCGICSRSNGIGLPTRARGEGRTTGIDRRGSAWIGLSAIGLTRSATVGSTGISSRRAIGWRRGVGWPRSVGWGRAVGRGRSAILCIRPRHPGGRSQNAHSCDCDKSAFHRLPPFCLKN